MSIMPAPNKNNISSDQIRNIHEKAEAASDFLKILANENRMIILCFLAKGEKSVTELEELLSLRQSTVSQQLARLRDENLVRFRREGKTIYYSLASEQARQVITALYDLFCAPPPRA